MGCSLKVSAQCSEAAASEHGCGEVLEKVYIVEKKSFLYWDVEYPCTVLFPVSGEKTVDLLTSNWLPTLISNRNALFWVELDLD